LIRPQEVPLLSAWDSLGQTHATISKSGSSSTLTNKDRPSHPESNTRSPPVMRPRGLTDSRVNELSGLVQTDVTYSRSASVVNSQSSLGPPITSPRVISRQASTSRIGSPPSAPPRHELPPPPLANDAAKDNDPGAGGSASSSSLSFATTVSSNKEVYLSHPYRPQSRENRSASPSSGNHDAEHPGNTFSKGSQSPSTTPRPPNSALSHQSLVKRGSSSSSPAPDSDTLPPERMPEKVLHKQRPFHQAKSSKFSTSPMRHTNSFGSQSPVSVSDGIPSPDQLRDSASTLPIGRKRLFSGSNLRRLSTAQQLSHEDDTHSVFSIPSELEQVSSFAKPVSPGTSFSFWDECTHDHASDSSHPATHEYTPQYIMSPAEMAKVEASVEESSIHRRTRGLSVVSASSATSDGDESVAPSSPSPLTHVGASTSLPQRSNSLLLTGFTIPQRLAVRPSTSDAHIPVPSTYSVSLQPSSSSQTMTSLPPPPRPRPRPSLVAKPSLEDEFGRPPSPPVRRSLRAKLSLEKTFHRRSIMRKPSFLDIDDDTDKESDGEGSGIPLNGSFLDLARESFDTVRSVSD
jgi:hypothetical protein